MRPDILIPVLMGCAMLWLIGRGIAWTAKLIVVAVTLALVAGVLLFERGMP